MNNTKKYRRKLLLYAIDIAIFAVIFTISAVASSIRSGGIGIKLSVYLINFAIFALALTAARLIFRVYSNVWRYSNT